MGAPAVQPMEALAGKIISPADYAILGGQLGSAGIDQAEIANLMSMVERTALEVSVRGAKETAMSVVTTMVALIAQTHRAASMEIYRQLCNQTGGLGGTLTHRKCAQIALNVAQSAPRHAPVPATPIIGSVR